MLKRENRLTKRGSFRYLYNKGDRAGGTGISLVYLGGKSGVRIGFSVPNKVGKAVRRNKVKRRLRASVRAYLPHFQKKGQLIFSAYPAAAEMSYDEIDRTVLKLLVKSGFINEKEEKDRV